MRRAFGLPQVLLIILFIGGIVTITMRYASLGAQHYTDSYTREQAELFLQSATEATLLEISGHDRGVGGTDCLSQINIISPDSKFQANITINKYYLSDGTSCNTPGLSESIQTIESNGIIDMTIIVTSNNTNTKILHPIRLERRSLQHP